jgi:hypothetical protein
MKRTLLHGVPRGQTSFDLITLQTPVSEMQDQLGRRELLLREERVDGDFIRQHGLIHVCPAQRQLSSETSSETGGSVSP